MAILRLLLLLAFTLSLVCPLAAQETQHQDRPNILWITSEDNSAHWIGCYGNTQAKTPHIDRLADQGVRFTHAYSNGAVCAVARSALLTGVHAVTQGTQHMRSRYPIPQRFRPYVTYLRDAGYYTTNNVKTDYNFAGNDRAWWDDCSRQAHYKNRPAGAPFFAIFNITTSHESSLFDNKTASYLDGRRSPRVAPDEVEVPPHLPDLPEVRRDLAIYHDIVTRMDREVGKVLAELAAAGLAESTIVFYFSDHGGILPRGKRYLHGTGTRVPLVIYIPPTFAHRFPHEPGTARDDVVQFVDLAPTLLHLAGIEIPEQMRGRLLFDVRSSVANDHVAFLYGDRFDETYRHQRAITDGRWRYIHNFMPHLPAALENEYPYGIASWRAWRDAMEGDVLKPRHRSFFQSPQPHSEFFLTRDDPWEVENRALTAPTAPLIAMRRHLRQEMLYHHDLGLIPEPFWPELAPQGPIYDYAHRGDFPWEEVVDASFKASMATEEDRPHLIELMSDDHPVLRYWGALGCIALSGQALVGHDATAANELVDVLAVLEEDPHAANRITAYHALQCLEPRDEYLNGLVQEATSTTSDPAATLAFHTLYQLQSTDRVPADALARIAESQELPYAARWAKRIESRRSRSGPQRP